MKYREDQMTARERMLAFSKGKEVDRIPCRPLMGEGIVRYMGITMRDFYNSADLMVGSEIFLYNKFKHDGVSIDMSLRGMAEAMGSKLDFPKHSFSIVKEHAINNVNEIESLKPANPLKDGRLPMFLEAAEKLNKKIGHEVIVGTGVTAPFTVAANLVGTENLLKWMIKYPKKVHTLMEIIVESNNNYIEKVCELGLGIGYADPVSSTSLISKKHFKEFSMPYLKMNSDKIRELSGRNPSIHICGKSKDIWEDIMETGISSFSIDNIEDLSEAAQIMGNKITIMGNVPPVDVMKLGTPKDVEKAAQKCIQKGIKARKGFILSTGCGMPVDTSLDNIAALVNSARKYGTYPLNEELIYGDI